MVYPVIAVALLIFFAGYLIWLLLIKKDFKQFRAVLFPGLFFIAVWIIIYILVMK